MTQTTTQQQKSEQHSMAEDKIINKNTLPVQVFKSAGSTEERSTATQIAKDDKISLLRRFHLGDQSVRSQLPPLQKPCIPALLYPYYGNKLIRSKYPLLLTRGISSEQTPNVQTLYDLLPSLYEILVKTGRPNPALQNNLLRFEAQIRSIMAETKQPVAAQEVFAAASNELIKNLSLAKENQQKLKSSFEQLTQVLPEDSYLLGYNHLSSLQLFLHLVTQNYLPRLSAFKTELKVLVSKLKERQQLNEQRSGDGHKSQAIKNSLGSVAASLFDADALSSVLKHTEETTVLTEKDLNRISWAVSTIEQFLADDNWQSLTLVHNEAIELDSTLLYSAIESKTGNDPCLECADLFDSKAELLAELFCAARIARLEISGEYDPHCHDPWFDNFNWESFSKDELMLVPPIIALEDANLVASDGMQSFSRALCSGRPIHIMVEVSPAANPGTIKHTDPLDSFRLELGYLAISHRRALVCQSSAAYPEHLLKGFRLSLQSTCTSVHLISSINESHSSHSNLQAWLIDGAAIESRAHPLFNYNPQAGTCWADQMDLSQNPSMQLAWPMDDFHFRKQSDTLEADVSTEKLAFTFADYALLEPELHQFFLPIPDDLVSEDFIPFQDYMNKERVDREKLIPYLYAVNADGILQRLAVARIMKLTCKDRQRYWHKLQELAGIDNSYVARAIELAEHDTKKQLQKQIDDLEKQHQQKLEQVRYETAREAMKSLAKSLVSLDLKGSIGSLLGADNQQEVDTKDEHCEEQTSETEAEEITIIATDKKHGSADEKNSVSEATHSNTEEKITIAEEKSESAEPSSADTSRPASNVPEEPWIDSALCTSCNDCFRISSSLFSYDENKQAFINNPQGGSFEQLVKAAELCPAQCIHPGTPLNPDEPDLEALLQRAMPFNQL